MARGISIKDLCVSYGAIEALTNVSLEVAPGEIVAVLGANGAGKTTLLSAIVGLIPIKSGEVLVDNVAMNSLRPEYIARSGVRLVPEGRRIFTRLTVEENLRLGAYFSSKSVFLARFDELAERFPLLAERRRSYAGYLSGGEQQIVALARSLISKPDVLLLDEPSAGLSPIATANVYKSLKAVAEESGLTILLVEQNVRAALAIANRGYVLELGSVRLSGQRDQLENDERVTALYLGTTD
jgi:branched-chain amino acid transport system ATP-binding protein